MKWTRRTILNKLNKQLLKRQNITDTTELEALYKELNELFKKAEQTMCSCTLKKLAKELTDLEFKLQKAWNFSQDQKFHSYWFLIPHCTCPKLDNQERIGLNQRIISEDCIVHGRKHSHCKS